MNEVSEQVKFGATMGEITEITRKTSAANDATSAKLDKATATGRFNATDLVDELSETYTEPNARLAKLVSWVEVDVKAVDAAITMALDGLEDHTDMPEVRDLLRLVATLGGEAEVFVAAQTRVVRALDALGSGHETLRQAVGRQAASLERLVVACTALVSLGARARAMGPYRV